MLLIPRRGLRTQHYVEADNNFGVSVCVKEEERLIYSVTENTTQLRMLHYLYYLSTVGRVKNPFTFHDEPGV